MDRARLLKEQARLLRDIADGSHHHDGPIRERLHKLAQECEELANVLERSLRGS